MAAGAAAGVKARAERGALSRLSSFAARFAPRASPITTPFLPLFVALVAASWAALWWWSASPYARYLEHPGWLDATSFAAFCRSVAVPAGAHALAWLLMIAAMMLPTTWPLLATFRRITAARSDAALLLVLICAGFVAVWSGFGVLAWAFDESLRAWVQRSDTFVRHGWLLGATVLAGAGLFQFSKLKYRCLDACQSPFVFVAARWHGRAPRTEALRLGAAHGAFCIGCCWALMLVTFVVGMGSVGWMLALAAVMAAEKNLPWGRRLRAPLGIGLLLAAAAVALPPLLH